MDLTGIEPAPLRVNSSNATITPQAPGPSNNIITQKELFLKALFADTQ